MELTNTKNFAYIRVSSKDQNLARQIDSLKQYVSDERDIFADKMSGKDFNRPAFQTLKNIVRAGDTIYVHEMERLGRNKQEILENLRYFKDKTQSQIAKQLGISQVQVSRIEKRVLKQLRNTLQP